MNSINSDSTTMKVLPDDTLANTDTIQESDGDESESDCVFNSDYKGLTTDWLKDVGKTNFVWRADLDQASISVGQDTIYISKGGCEHMGMLVELRLSNDDHSIADSAFWLNKALAMATEFGLKHYEQMIKAKRIKKIESSKNVIWFEIEDDNPDDNLYYNGVEVNLEKQSKVVSLSQYRN